MFRSRADSNIVYKCTVRLLEDSEILECEFHVSFCFNLVNKNSQRNDELHLLMIE